MIFFFFSRLTERATWRGGKRLQTSGGERAGRSGWYFTLFLFLGFTNNVFPKKSLFVFHHPIIMEGLYLFWKPTNKSSSSIVPSSQGGLLWRLAWYLRFFLPSYYAEHTHGKDSSEKSNQEVFLTGRYIFPTAGKAQL